MTRKRRYSGLKLTVAKSFNWIAASGEFALAIKAGRIVVSVYFFPTSDIGSTHFMKTSVVGLVVEASLAGREHDGSTMSTIWNGK
jgi:hypothetical protein